MKRMLALMLSAVMALTLAACGQTAAPAPAGSAAASGSAAGSATGEVTTIRLGHVVVDGSSLDKGVDEFAKLVAEKSNGSIKIDVYPNSALGDNSALAEQLQFGSLEMSCPSIAAVSGFCKDTAIFDMPYLFKNNAAAEEALDGELGGYVAAGLETAGFHVLGYMTQGWRHVTCNKEVHQPSDMAGIKIRTMDSKFHMLNFNSIGASATPMAFSEVYTALQQKTIDAQENPYTNIVSSRLYEVQDYVIETGHIYDVCPLLFSTALWSNLTADQQAIIEEAAKEAVAAERQIVVDDEDVCRTTVTDSGTTIVTLTDDERAAFKAAAQPVYDQFLAEYPDNGADLLAKAEEANANN